MCGLWGLVDLRGLRLGDGDLHGLSERLTHRGPDGEGRDQEEAAAFGPRPPATLDLTDHAREPMRSRDGRYVVVYNGEIFNFRDLASEPGLPDEDRRGDTTVLV